MNRQNYIQQTYFDEGEVKFEFRLIQRDCEEVFVKNRLIGAVFGVFQEFRWERYGKPIITGSEKDLQTARNEFMKSYLEMISTKDKDIIEFKFDRGRTDFLVNGEVCGWYYFDTDAEVFVCRLETNLLQETIKRFSEYDCKTWLSESYMKGRVTSLRSRNLTLKELQAQLPWGDSYSQEFQDNKQSHRDWNHAVLHVIKAAGKLAALGEELDHRENNPHLGHEETAAVHALADLVICSLRLANVFPVRPIDLESAVLTRLKEKNPEYKGVKDA